VAVRALRSLKAGEGVTDSVVGLGMMVGTILGFLLRSSVPLIGQLPFSVVLDREVISMVLTWC